MVRALHALLVTTKSLEALALIKRSRLCTEWNSCSSDQDRAFKDKEKINFKGVQELAFSFDSGPSSGYPTSRHCLEAHKRPILDVISSYIKKVRGRACLPAVG